MRKTLIAFAAVAAVLATPATAASAESTVTITVQTSDLDLATTAGQESLDNRVEYAIDRACRSGGRDLASRRAEAACRETFSEMFAPQVELAISEARTQHLASLELRFEA